jgi:hypothetical protein
LGKIPACLKNNIILVEHIQLGYTTT